MSDAARGAVRVAARDLAVEAPAVAAATDAVICERLDITDEEIRASLAASTLAHVTLIAGMLGASTDPRTAVPPPETLRWAADLVRDGRSPAELLRAYRIGHGEVWAGWQRLLRPHCPDTATLDEATAHTSAFLFDYVDTVLQPLLDRHAEEVGRASARRETMRAETLRDLLAGERPDVQAAGARLRYAIDRTHVGLALWALPGGTPEDRLERLQAAAARLDPRALTAPGAGDVLHAWVASARPPALAAVPGVVIAAGRPGRGLEGFRTTHAEARRALEVARAGGVRGAVVVHYADVEVVALLQSDPAEARAFAQRTLASLGEDLLATLRALHDEGMNVGLTARRLGVHPNTVGSRVRRILQLTGETDPGSLRLRAAVALAPGAFGG
jgi:hypothetical protein